MPLLTKEEFLDRMTDYTSKVVNNENVPEEYYTTHLGTLFSSIILSYPEALKARAKHNRAHFWRIVAGAGVGKTQSALNIASRLLYLHAFVHQALERGLLNDDLKKAIAGAAKEVFAPYVKAAGLENAIDWEKWTDNFIEGVKEYGKSGVEGNIANLQRLKNSTEITNELLKVLDINRSFVMVNKKGQVVPTSGMKSLPPIATIDDALSNIKEENLEGYGEFIDSVGTPGVPFAVLLETENPNDIVYDRFRKIVEGKAGRISRAGLPVEVRGSAAREFGPIEESIIPGLAEDFYVASILDLIGKALDGDKHARNMLIDLRAGEVSRADAEKEVDEILSSFAEDKDTAKSGFSRAIDFVKTLATNDALRARISSDYSSLLDILADRLGDEKVSVLKKFISKLGYDFKITRPQEKSKEVRKALADFLFDGKDEGISKLEGEGKKILEEAKTKPDETLERVRESGKALSKKLKETFPGEFAERLSSAFKEPISNEAGKPFKYDKRMLMEHICSVGDKPKFNKIEDIDEFLKVNKEFFENDRRFLQLKEVYEGIKKSVKDERLAKEIMTDVVIGVLGYSPAGFLVAAGLGLFKEKKKAEIKVKGKVGRLGELKIGNKDLFEYAKMDTPSLQKLLGDDDSILEELEEAIITNKKLIEDRISNLPLHLEKMSESDEHFEEVKAMLGLARILESAPRGVSKEIDELHKAFENLDVDFNSLNSKLDCGKGKELADIPLFASNGGAYLYSAAMYKVAGV